MKQTVYALVYRLRNSVALSIDGCPTVYLPLAMAQNLSDALLTAARDIEHTPEFSDSKLHPVDVRPEREVNENDIDKQTILVGGRSFLVQSFCGVLLPTDVGKRLRLSGDVLQMENDEQRARRLAR